MKSIPLTPELQARIQAVRDALVTYHPGYESSSVVEVPKLALADALLSAIASCKAQQLETVGRPAPATVRLPKRRRRA